MSKKSEDLPISNTPVDSDIPSQETENAASQTNPDFFQKVQETAYLNAELNNFSGDPTEHWFEAEREVKELYGLA
jgi:hypothetical protein